MSMNFDYWNEQYFFDNIGFVLKISERCNLACKYCYFFFQKDRSYLKNPAIIPINNVKAYAKFIANLGKQNGIP